VVLSAVASVLSVLSVLSAVALSVGSGVVLSSLPHDDWAASDTAWPCSRPVVLRSRATELTYAPWLGRSVGQGTALGVGSAPESVVVSVASGDGLVSVEALTSGDGLVSGEALSVGEAETVTSVLESTFDRAGAVMAAAVARPVTAHAPPTRTAARVFWARRSRRVTPSPSASHAPLRRA
jgi:hypothetical protein